MASGMSVKLSLDASGFTNGMKHASESTKEYTNQISRVTQNLPNARRQYMQTQREVQNMTIALKQMTKEQRNSADGRALASALEDAKLRAGDLRDAIMDVNDEIKYLASDTKTLDSFNQGFQVVGGTLSAVQSGIALVTGNTDSLKKAIAAFTTVQSIANTLTAIGNAIQKQSALYKGIANLQTKAGTLATKLETAAKSKNIIVTKLATVAQRALNAAMKANPIGIMITGLTALVALFGDFSDGADDATESMEEQEDQTRRLKNEQDKAHQLISTRVADTTGEFIRLSTEWQNLTTEAEKLAWIDNNINAFKQLGLKITNVTEANEVFIKQMPKILNALKLQAEAAANLELYIEKYKERQARIANPNMGNGGYRLAPEKTWDKVLRGETATINGVSRDYSDFNDRQSALADMAAKYGLVQGVDYNMVKGTGMGDTYFDTIGTLTEAGKKKMKEIESNAANERAKLREDEEDAFMTYYLNAYEQKTKEAKDAAKDIPLMYNPNTSYDPYVSNRRTDARTSTRANPRERARTNERTKVRQSEKQTISKEAENAKQEIKVGLEALEEQRNVLQKKISEIIDPNGDGTTVLKGQEENYKLWSKQLENVNKKIDNANKLINPENQQPEEIGSYMDQLKANIDEWDAEYRKLWDGTKFVDEERARELYDKIMAAKKEYENSEKILDDMLTVKMDPREEYFNNKINEATNTIADLKYTLEIQPELGEFDKAKIRKQITDQEKLIEKYRNLINPPAKEENKIEEDIIIDVDPTVKTKQDEIKEVVVKKKNDWVKALNEEFANIKWDEAIEFPVLEKLMGNNAKDLMNLKVSAKQNDEQGIQEVKSLWDAGILGTEQAQNYIDAFNEHLKSVGLEPIDIKLNKEKMKQDISEVANTIGAVSSSISTAFSAMNDLYKSNNEEDNKGFQVGKIIAQAVATLAMSFAQAMAKSGVTIWDWIAGGITGMATLLTMVSQINNLKGYAEGGIVGGHSYYGDKLLIRANSGEAILNEKQQQRLWNMIGDNNTYIANTRLSGEVVIRADQMKLLLSNYDKKHNKMK